MAPLPRQNGPSIARGPRKVRKEGGITRGAGADQSPARGSGATVVLKQLFSSRGGWVCLEHGDRFGAQLTRAGQGDGRAAEAVQHLQLWEPGWGLTLQGGFLACAPCSQGVLEALAGFFCSGSWAM